MSKSLAAIKSDMDSTMNTNLQTTLNSKLLGNYTNTSVGSKMKISPFGLGYEMYPKIFFTGDSSKTIIQHNLFADLTMNDLKDIVNIYLQANNAKNIIWFIDYSSGEQKIIDFTSIP